MIISEETETAIRREANVKRSSPETNTFFLVNIGNLTEGYQKGRPKQEDMR
jgi:hypothetical protein